MINLKELEQKINDVDTLQIFTTDLNGRSVTLQVHAGNAESFFKKGVGFDGSSVPGYGTVENSDKLLIPLPETYREVPFAQENLGFLIGKEAPIVRGWGFKNRSSMVRVPYAEGAKDTRIEIRSPDPSGNIYLQIATLIGMGLQGIREKIDCGDPDIGNLSDTKSASHLMDTNFLPRNMFEALVEAENSSFLKDFLGDPLYCQYMSLKIDEWENYRTFVTFREHKMNFHI